MITVLANSSGIGSTSLNSTGADLLVAVYSGNVTGTWTDGNANSGWVKVQDANNVTADLSAQIWVCETPATLGAAHSFTTAVYNVLSVYALSNATAASYELGAAFFDAATPFQAGAITTANNEDFIIAAISYGPAGVASIDSGFTIDQSVPGNPGTSYGLAAASLQQAVAGVTNPAWTHGTATQMSAVVAAFKSVLAVAVPITSAAVSSNGSSVAITLSASGTVTTSNIAITMGGYPVAISSVSGSGTAWTATLGARWVRSGTAVSVTGSSGLSGTVAATNNSIITSNRVKYVGRQFSMFLHFNMETFTDVEWGTGSESPNTFAPTGNIGSMIDTWIAGAKLAGMKSLCLTAKHHSGFCLWPSSTTAHDIASSSWYSGAGSPDILGMYVQKCRAAGLGVGVYFSIWDKNFEINTPGFTGLQYKTHTQAQLAEILNNYGPIDYLWFDGYAWLGNADGVQYATIALTDVYDYPKTIQPNCVVAINDHRHDLSTSDIDIFENYLGYPAVGSPVPGEFAETIRADAKWFWKLAADANKTASAIITEKATVNGRKSHYLLNCPPNRTGGLQTETLRVLAGIGASVAEAVDGISVSSGSGTYPPVSVTVTLTTDGTALAANLTGLTWAFWDSPTPKYQGRPTAQGINATTNASGVFSVKVYSSLTAGQVGWLVVTNSDGTTTQNPAHKEFSGPVAVT